MNQMNDFGTKMLQAAMTVTREGCRGEEGLKGYMVKDGLNGMFWCLGGVSLDTRGVYGVP